MTSCVSIQRTRIPIVTSADLKPSWTNETGRLLRLAGPLIVNNLSLSGMQFADTVMSGRISAETLAAVAVGGGVWLFVFTIGLGLMMAISPIAARDHGAGQPEMIGRYTRQGIYLGLALAIPMIIIGALLTAPLVLMTIAHIRSSQ